MVSKFLSGRHGESSRYIRPGRDRVCAVNPTERCLAPKVGGSIGGGTEIRGGGSDDITIPNGILQFNS